MRTFRLWSVQFDNQIIEDTWGSPKQLNGLTKAQMTAFTIRAYVSNAKDIVRVSGVNGVLTHPNREQIDRLGTSMADIITTLTVQQAVDLAHKVLATVLYGITMKGPRAAIRVSSNS